MEDYFDDLDFKELSHEEAFAIFDEYYGDAPLKAAIVEVAQKEPLTAPSEVLEADLISPDGHDEFAGLMDGIEQLPDAPLLDDVLPTTTSLEDPSTGSHPPETSSFLAPGPLASSIFEDRRSPYSPELPRGDVAGIIRVQLSPVAPSSENRSLMQAEMRDEEDLQTSPLPATAGSVSRLSLGTSIRIAEAQTPGTDSSGDVHMDENTNSQADLSDDLPSAKSWHFDSLSPIQNADLTKQQAEDTPAAPPDSIDPTSQPIADAEPRAKRRRKTSSPVVLLSWSLGAIQANAASSQEPPAKKQKAGTPDTDSTGLEILHPKSGELTGPQSHAKQDTDPQPTKAAEEGDSSLTEPTSEHIPSSPVTSTPVPGNKMATPEVSASVNKVEVKKAVQASDTTPAEEESTLEDTMPDGKLAESPKWSFAALKEGTPPGADSDTPSPKKKPTKGKGKGKVKAKAKATDVTPTATKRGKSASIEPAANMPAVKKGRVGKQELDDLIGSTVLKGVAKMNASPRKTRKGRKDEEAAKPNAAGAAKRRQSGGAKGK